MNKINPKLNKEAESFADPIIKFCKDNGIKSFNMFLMGGDFSFYGHDKDYYSKDDKIFDVYVEDAYGKTDWM